MKQAKNTSHPEMELEEKYVHHLCDIYLFLLSFCLYRIIAIVLKGYNNYR